MSMKRSLGMAAILVASTLAACAPMQTFPATVGKPTFDPSVPPTPELFRVGIVTGHKQSSVSDQPIVFNLPLGVRDVTWTKVRTLLGDGARPMQPGDTGVITVEAVRFSGGQAEVDVVVPKGEIYQLFTLHLSGGGIGPWRVDYVQPWTLRTAVPTDNSPSAMASVTEVKGETAEH